MLDDHKYSLYRNIASIPEITGENLVFDVTLHSEYAFFCGKFWLITKVTDLKHDPSIDPVPENNFKAMPMVLRCPEGNVSIEQSAFLVMIEVKHTIAYIELFCL